MNLKFWGCTFGLPALLATEMRLPLSSFLSLMR